MNSNVRKINKISKTSLPQTIWVGEISVQIEPDTKRVKFRFRLSLTPSGLTPSGLTPSGLDGAPSFAFPPLAGDVDAVGTQGAAAHRLEALAFPDDLSALSGESPLPLFVLGRHPDDAESLEVAPGVAVQSLAKRQGVDPVSLHALAALVTILRLRAPVEGHLLDRLRRGAVDLPGAVLPLRMGVDSELDQITAL